MKNTALNACNTDIFKSISHIINNDASKHIILPNVCSPMNKFISGFSKELYKHYPEIETTININTPKKMCSCITVKTNPKTKSQLIVANMYCQTKNSQKRIINYGQLVLCMYEIKNIIFDLKHKFPDFSTEIHCTKFGIGMAGGNWNFISDLINDIWNNNNVYVYNHTRKTTNAY